ncbi:MAG: MFS transporter, partial [Solirubrobacterales bacterium]
GVPRAFPNASPRRVVKLGFLGLFLGIVTLTLALEVGVGAEVVTWPMLLAGLGIGALASQLGSVTVSAVPDEQSAEVGGLQNTVTFLGASIGTALAGAVLISGLTTSFLTGVQENPAIPQELSSQAQVDLAGGVPFIPDDQLERALADAGVTGATAQAVIDENEKARLDGLRASLTVLGIIALLAMFFSNGIPTRQPGAKDEADPQAKPSSGDKAA